jgi:hypothetical protein
MESELPIFAKLLTEREDPRFVHLRTERSPPRRICGPNTARLLPIFVHPNTLKEL